MYKNNYDQSSTGINIEVGACYDTGLSRTYFEDSISNYNHSLYTYEINPESIRDFIEIDSKANHEELADLANELNEWCYYDEYSDEDLRELILDAGPELIMNRYWHEQLGSTLHLKPEFTLYRTRGYCQGDIETVLYKGDSMSASIQNSIDHLFWDAPVRAFVSINEELYEYWDYDLPEYEWKRDEFIEKILSQYKGEKSDYVHQQLEKMLPEELNYE